MVYVVLAWTYPLFLLGVDALVKMMFGMNFTSGIGPALAAIGSCFLLPLLVPKPVDDRLHPNTLKLLRTKGLLATSRQDQVIVVLSWVATIIGLFVLIFSLHEVKTGIDRSVWIVPSHIAAGSINYLAAAILTACKSRA